MSPNWSWIEPFLAFAQVVIGGLVAALYNSHKDAKKTQDRRVAALETKQAEHDVKIAKLEGYNNRAQEDRQETKTALAYLTQRVDEVTNSMIKREDLDRFTQVITAALAKKD